MIAFARIRCGGLSALLLAGALSAQQTTPAADDFTLPAGSVSLAKLLTAAREQLHWQIDGDASQLDNVEPLQLQSAIRTDRSGGEQVVRALLHARDLALVPVKDTYQLVPLHGAAAARVLDTAVVLTVEAVLRAPHDKRAVTTTLTLHNTNATVMIAVLRALSPPGRREAAQRLHSDGRQALTLTGFQDRVARLVQLAQLCDVPTVPANDLDSLTREADRLQQQLAALQAKLKQLQAGHGGGGK